MTRSEGRLYQMVSAIMRSKPAGYARKATPTLMPVKRLSLKPEDRVIVARVCGLNTQDQRHPIQALKGAKVLANDQPIAANVVCAWYDYDKSETACVHLRMGTEDDYRVALLSDLALST